MGEFKSRRRYDTEFKREAVRLVLENKKPTKIVAENLGIFPGLLYKWIRDYKEDPANSFPGKSTLFATFFNANLLYHQSEKRNVFFERC